MIEKSNIVVETMMAFSDTMRDMNFLPCKEDGDVWSLDEREVENKVEVED